MGLVMEEEDDDEEEELEGSGASCLSALPLAPLPALSLLTLVLVLCPFNPIALLSPSVVRLLAPMSADEPCLSLSCFDVAWANGGPSVVDEPGVELNPDGAEVSRPVELEVATEDDEERNSSEGRSVASTR